MLLQDIKVGKPAKPQLARAVKGPEEAYNIMKGRPFVVETKFDGEPSCTEDHLERTSSTSAPDRHST